MRHKAQKLFVMFMDVYAVSVRVVQSWFKRFQSGSFDINYAAHPFTD